MRVPIRFLLGLLLLGVLSLSASEPPTRYLYVGVPGSDLDVHTVGVSLLVFDIDRGHQFVKRIRIWPSDGEPERTRGLAVAPPSPTTGAGRPVGPRLYISTTRRLGAIDLASGTVRWEHAYRGLCCDQMAVSPNGQVLYAPAFGSPEWYVIDPAAGELVSTVHVIGWPRRTAFSRDGRLAYLSAWESNRLSIVDTTSNTITREIGPFSRYLCPFTINRKDTLVFANVDGLVGFEVADLHTGLILDRVQVDGYALEQLEQYECPSHGIAFTADDKELWVADGVDNRLRVFDATTYPPRETSSIPLTRQPRSIAFSHDGRFAYASTGDVLDVRTKAVVTTLKDETGAIVESERMVEVDVPSSSSPAVKGTRR